MVKNLRKLREEHGLSQQKLAEHFGISQQSVYKYENGLAEPDINMLINMADFFALLLIILLVTLMKTGCKLLNLSLTVN